MVSTRQNTKIGIDLGRFCKYPLSIQDQERMDIHEKGLRVQRLIAGLERGIVLTEELVRVARYVPGWWIGITPFNPQGLHVGVAIGKRDMAVPWSVPPLEHFDLKEASAFLKKNWVDDAKEWIKFLDAG